MHRTGEIITKHVLVICVLLWSIQFGNANPVNEIGIGETVSPTPELEETTMAPAEDANITDASGIETTKPAEEDVNAKTKPEEDAVTMSVEVPTNASATMNDTEMRATEDSGSNSTFSFDGSHTDDKVLANEIGGVADGNQTDKSRSPSRSALNPTRFRMRRPPPRLSQFNDSDAADSNVEDDLQTPGSNPVLNGSFPIPALHSAPLPVPVVHSARLHPLNASIQSPVLDSPPLPPNVLRSAPLPPNVLRSAPLPPDVLRSAPLPPNVLRSAPLFRPIQISNNIPDDSSNSLPDPQASTTSPFKTESTTEQPMDLWEQYFRTDNFTYENFPWDYMNSPDFGAPFMSPPMGDYEIHATNDTQHSNDTVSAGEDGHSDNHKPPPNSRWDSNTFQTAGAGSGLPMLVVNFVSIFFAAILVL